MVAIHRVRSSRIVGDKRQNWMILSFLIIKTGITIPVNIHSTCTVDEAHSFSRIIVCQRNHYPIRSEDILNLHEVISVSIAVLTELVVLRKVRALRIILRSKTITCQLE